MKYKCVYMKAFANTYIYKTTTYMYKLVKKKFYLQIYQKT